MGEASFIRDTLIQGVKDGIYLFGDQTSAHLENVSIHSSRYGINADNANSTIRVFGVSGDGNTSLVRIKGGVSLSVILHGLKAENYTAGTGDPSSSWTSRARSSSTERGPIRRRCVTTS
ncbi:hypothetical protein [Pseudarthrobacter sp. H2]|uniref:hypothetical protein n=1 Tax=Pseudarthrobacter sp. H2 TaxID=3418415 RepID=UPI003CEBBF88